MALTMDQVVEPLLDRFQPDWLLISAGFDAHRKDPLTGLVLTAGDYRTLVGRLVQAVPVGRTITFLEGGYSASGLRDSVRATVPVLAGEAPEALSERELPDEGSTVGGPGDRLIDVVAALWREQLA